MEKRNIAINGLVDIHTHSGGMDFSNLLRGSYPYCQDLSDLYFKGVENNVPHQVVFPMPTTCYYNTKEYWNTGAYTPSGLCEFPFEVENKHLLQAINSIPYEPTHFLPFLSFSLQDQVAAQEKEIVRLSSEVMHIYGLKLHTSADQSRADTIETKSQFLDIASDLNIPFMIHTGFIPVASSLGVIEMAAKHSKNRFCVAHFGGFSECFADQLERYPYNNVFFDTSGLFSLCKWICKKHPKGIITLDYANPLSVLSYYAARFPNHILWGSDAPWYNSINLNERSMTSLRTYAQEVHAASTIDLEIIINNSSLYLFG